jgi:DNA (cytosine-5)-methyltransferase 1
MSLAGLHAVDLFAGTGWGVAAQRLGIVEHGVELMPEAIATREANGMHTWMSDVWEVLEHAPLNSPEFNAALLIASPPCQTFSMAGGGAGRKALDEVLGLIDSRAYLDVAKLREFGERHDPRTSLVLTPLTYVAWHLPTYVVLEQVPPVLPVWERIADELRSWGYSAWAGLLHAEQYGVPQTRTRAVLIARNDGIGAAPPSPTHSRYYSRKPARLDSGVLPWVSAAEGAGWDRDEVAGFARRADDKGAATSDGYRARDLRPTDAPAQHVTEKARSWSHVKAERHRDAGMLERGGERPGRTADEPAPTVTGNASGTTPGGFAWVHDKPSSTIVGSFGADIIAGPGGSGVRPTDLSRHRQDRPGSVRVTLDEAAALQSYPPGFVWCGSRTKAFLQVGNAVPPLLAEAILNTLDTDT